MSKEYVKKRGINLRTRIIWGFAWIGFPFLVVVGVNIWLNHSVKNYANYVSERENNLHYIQTIQKDILAIDYFAQQDLLYGTNSQKERKGQQKEIRTMVKGLEMRAVNAQDTKDTRNFMEDFEMYSNQIQTTLDIPYLPKEQKAAALSQSSFKEISSLLEGYNVREEKRIENSKRQMEEQEQAFYIINAVAISVVLMLVFILSFVLLKHITKPIRRMQEELEQLSTQEGDLTVQLGVETDDEIGKASLAFNLMLERFRKIVLHVIEKTEEVVGRSQTLRTEIERTKENGTVVVSLAQEVTVISDQQVENSERTMQEVAVIKEQLKRFVMLQEQVASASDGMAHQVVESQNIIAEMEKQMSFVSASSEHTMQQVRVFGEAMRDIEKTVHVLQEIAAHTNLLSLNANIEAEKAGVHGRGFAVVAESVRELADGSAEQSEEITRTLQRIQGQTEKLEKQIEKERKQVEQSMDLIVQTRKSFQNMLDYIKHVSVELGNTSQTSGELAERLQGAIQYVSHNVVQANQVNEHAKNANEWVSKQQDITSDVVRLNQELQKAASELQTAMKRMKVDPN